MIRSVTNTCVSFAAVLSVIALYAFRLSSQGTKQAPACDSTTAPLNLTLEPSPAPSQNTSSPRLRCGWYRMGYDDQERKREQVNWHSEHCQYARTKDAGICGFPKGELMENAYFDKDFGDYAKPHSGNWNIYKITNGDCNNKQWDPKNGSPDKYKCPTSDSKEYICGSFDWTCNKHPEKTCFPIKARKDLITNFVGVTTGTWRPKDFENPECAFGEHCCIFTFLTCEEIA